MRRVGQPLPLKRAYACNKTVVDDFFVRPSATFERLNLRNKPQNVDETSFQTDTGSQKVFCQRGLKNPQKMVAMQLRLLTLCRFACQLFVRFYHYIESHLHDTAPVHSLICLGQGRPRFSDFPFVPDPVSTSPWRQ
jgi:hypothetical protein